MSADLHCRMGYTVGPKTSPCATLLPYGIRLEIYSMLHASNAGPSGIYHLLVSWTFTILKVALLVRVVSSWLPVSPYSRWVAWSYRLSEPVLAPLRRIVPNLGMLDITPILAYFLLNIIESLLFNLV